MINKSTQLSRLLRPRSVAVVGASATPGALGASVISNLDRLAFGGELYLINPNREFIGKRACLKSVDALPPGVDVAVLAIPHAAVLPTVKALVERGVGAAIIFSAGFAEGGESGLAEQRELSRIASDSGMVIVGPNCLGLVNYVDGVALTFVETPAAGLANRAGVGIVSQSGAMAAVLGVTLASRQIGVSYSVSTGNEAASGVEDYLEYLLDDPNTSVIALIVEQFREPKRFLSLASSARARGKPMILLHPGRSQAARESAATHTGAMAGDYKVMLTQTKARGVRIADDLEHYGDLIELAFRCRVPSEPGTVVLTESGAFKALALDLCEHVGITLPSLNDDDAPELREALPDFVPVSNPVDLTAQGLVDPEIYRRSLAALMKDERFGVIVLCIIQTDPGTSAAKFPTIISALRDSVPKKTVIFAGMDEGAVVPDEFVIQLRELGVPYFAAPDRTFRALASFLEPLPVASSENQAALAGKFPRDESTGFIPEYRSKEILKAIGIPFPDGRLVTTLAEAQHAARELGMPVALKAQAAALPHKSDAGGVVLGLKDADQVAEGWHRLQTNISKNCPGVKLDGVLVEAMSKPGLELIVGGRTDPQWGTTMLAGFGGVQAEIIKDVVLFPAELNKEAVESALYSLKGAEQFRGYRGSEALDVRSVAHMITQVAALLRAEPSIQEIDLNPVFVYPAGLGAVALDALILKR